MLTNSLRRRETANRHSEELRRLLGDLVGGYLAEDDTTDIILNPPLPGEADGRVWVTRLGHESEPVGFMSPAQAEALISAVASTMGNIATADDPVVEGVLIIDGSRFEGLIPPIVAAPVFAIRRRASAVFPLSAYVERGQLSARHRDVIEDAVSSRKNILICGGTGSGKSTLMNAVIDAIVRLTPEHRILGIEDTVELQCAARNACFMRTSPTVSMRELLRPAMRLFPDRILIGEVRGPEALDMLMAWGTGHPGSAATIHSDTGSPRAALSRLELLLSLATQAPMQKLIAETVGMIVCIERGQKGQRRVTQIVAVEGFDGHDYRLRTED